jgi:hypothetical protein
LDEKKARTVQVRAFFFISCTRQPAPLPVVMVVVIMVIIMLMRIMLLCALYSYLSVQYLYWLKYLPA